MKYNMNSVNGSNYDPKSVMLYSYPAEVTNNNKGTYRNIRLSEQDKKWLSSIYPTDGSPRKFPSRTGEGSQDTTQTLGQTFGDRLKTNIQALQQNLQKVSILGLDPRWSVLIIVIIVMVIFSLVGYIIRK